MCMFGVLLTTIHNSTSFKKKSLISKGLQIAQFVFYPEDMANQNSLGKIALLSNCHACVDHEWKQLGLYKNKQTKRIYIDMQDNALLIGLDQGKLQAVEQIQDLPVPLQYYCSTGRPICTYIIYSPTADLRICDIYPQRMKYSAGPFMEKFADLYFKISRESRHACGITSVAKFTFLAHERIVLCAVQLSFSSIVHEHSFPTVHRTNCSGLRKPLPSYSPGDMRFLELRAGVNDDGSEVNTLEA